MSGTWRWALVVTCLLTAGCTALPNETPTETEDLGSPTATAEPTPTPEPTSAAPVWGTGTVTVDGTVLPVSGDCDISRDFGREPVDDLDDDDLDVLLAVDNLTGDGDHDGPFPIEVTLLGSGPVIGRPITSVGAEGDAGADLRFQGTIEAAELRDRQAQETLDVATLHVEATQQRDQGSGAPETRSLVVDVVCPISRPS